MTAALRMSVQRLLIISLFSAAAGCSPSAISLVPEPGSAASVAGGVAAEYKLIEHDPPGGPATVSLTSGGVARAVLQDGIPVALLHVRIAFVNRTGLDIVFDGSSVRAATAPAVIQSASPAWVRPADNRLDAKTIPAGKNGTYDIYFILGRPQLVGMISSVTIDWEYMLGEEHYGTSTVFVRGYGAYGRRYGQYSYYGDYRATYPYFGIWWWPLSVGRSHSFPSPVWRRR
ncbi:MAG: hypothetical protein JW909_11495 [Planctomycetes bacterium]|nr:hypothetical protein [Planctomycetota bacterium]